MTIRESSEDNKKRRKRRGGSGRQRGDSAMDDGDISGTATFVQLVKGFESGNEDGVSQACAELTTFLASRGAAGLGNESNLRQLIQLCIDSENTLAIECANQICEYMCGDESREFLEAIFRDVSLHAPPIPKDKHFLSMNELYQKYCHFLRNIEHKIDPDFDMINDIWEALLKSPNAYQAMVLATLNQYDFVSNMSLDQKVAFLQRLVGFLQRYGAKKQKRKKIIAHKMAKCFRLAIGAVFVSSAGEDAPERLVNQLDEMMHVCIPRIRNGWIKPPVASRGSSAVSSTAMSTCHSHDSDGDEDDIYATDDEEDDRNEDTCSHALAFNNMNVYEGCLHEIVRSIRCGPAAELKFGLLKRQLQWLTNRMGVMTEMDAELCAERGRTCECRVDLITDSCVGAMVEYYAVQHPESAYEDSKCIIQVVQRHHKSAYLRAVTKLYPYRGNAFCEVFDSMFKFGITENKLELYPLIEAAAQFNQDTVERTHIDELERILRDSDWGDEVEAIFRVLKICAETNPGELMHGRGKLYHQAALRFSSNNHRTLLFEANEILRCVALSDQSEAERVASIYERNCTSGEALMSEEKFVNDTLYCCIYLAMFYPRSLSKIESWIHICTKDDSTETNATRIFQILRGKETEPPPRADGKSSLCALM